MKKTLALAFFIAAFFSAKGQKTHSIARLWNEQLLLAISGDFARPTVHARNLFHVSAAMWDAWAVYDPTARPYFLERNVHGFEAKFRRPPPPADVEKAREEAISFAAFRLIRYRFEKAPGAAETFKRINDLMDSLGYDYSNQSTNYLCGGAEMGNFIAQTIIEYGLQDGSNQAGNHANQFYQPANPAMKPELPGLPAATDLNRWQPLEFATFIDQSGNSFSNFVTKFQTPEWGFVQPFSLQPSQAEQFERNLIQYNVYLNPGPPALLDLAQKTPESEEYQWNHALVAAWGALLDPADGVMMDASPAAIGNNQNYPTTWAGLHDFFDFFDGGDSGLGHALNPKTGQPYQPQIVPRGDYCRVLAEFWADGPLSVTPPGHWFEILNYVNDQPDLVRKVRATGPLCTPLEWDVKSYFALGGAMHDAAITAWSIKNRHDSSRPITAIRGMAALGQSSDPSKPSYHPAGLPLIPNRIELIEAGDPLQGSSGQHVGKIKLKTWRGPNFIVDPETDVAGAGWIRAEIWYPYQRPTFVSPPFAGFVSGHSTYSRAAAEVLTELTGDAFFPGGMGVFQCKKNEFLVFEDGPSQDIELQWATYRDASDQCSLSRIFGGIHPPMDDIPGRFLGMKIGPQALVFAEQFFAGKMPEPAPTARAEFFPNPTDCVSQIVFDHDGPLAVRVFAADGRLVFEKKMTFSDRKALLDLSDTASGVYFVEGEKADGERVFLGKAVRF